MVDKISDVKVNWALGAMIAEINSFSRSRGGEGSRAGDYRSDSIGVLLLSLLIGAVCDFSKGSIWLFFHANYF